MWQSLLYRGLDFEGDVLKHPEYLEEAYQAGLKAAQTKLTDKARNAVTRPAPSTTAAPAIQPGRMRQEDAVKAAMREAGLRI